MRKPSPRRVASDRTGWQRGATTDRSHEAAEDAGRNSRRTARGYAGFERPARRTASFRRTGGDNPHRRSGIVGEARRIKQTREEKTRFRDHRTEDHREHRHVQ